MKRIALGFLAVLLSSCAGVNDLVSDKSSGELLSHMGAEAGAECVRDAWQEQRIGASKETVGNQKKGDDFLVISPAGPTPVEVVVVKPTMNGSHMAMYTRNFMRKTKRLSAMQSCQ